MGERGPVPKRSTQRHGHRSKAEQAVQVAATPQGMPIEPDAEWHPAARDWFLSLGESAQSEFYQPSDWRTAWVWAEILSRQLSTSRTSAQMISAWSSAAGELLTTEGARRRARLELERKKPEEEAPDVSELDEYRRRLKSG